MGGQGLQASEPLVCLEELEACIVKGFWSQGWSRSPGLLEPLVCLEVLEACIVKGSLPLGWPSFAGHLSPWYVWRWSRHAWLKVQCLMGGRGWQASEPMIVP